MLSFHLLLLLLVSQIYFRLDFGLFAKSEIAEFDVPILLKEDIVGLEIAVNVVEFMHSLYSQDHFSHKELRLFFSEDVFFHKNSHKIPPFQELHDKIQILFILEATLHLDYPRTVDSKYDLLPPDMSDLVFLKHFFLFHFLDSYSFPCVYVLAHSHFSKGTSPDDLN